jgi:Na+-translocating ferredoxin:NAD+ oxidoreductase subunit B
MKILSMLHFVRQQVFSIPNAYRRLLNMTDPHILLAAKLNRTPNGFPSTKSGVELRILKKIFSPEDARMALKVHMRPESAEGIAKRLREPAESTRARLDAMAEKGQIAAFKMAGVRKYVFMPFVIGIYEFQLKRLDKELSNLFEEYIPHLTPVLGGTKPALARVIPVNTVIDPNAEIVTYERLDVMIRGSRSFAINECICRKERALQGHPCKHTLETCMTFSREENAFDRNPLAARIISKDEALRVLDTVEKEGLVHATYNVREGLMFVCNCCSCCCGLLRGMNEFHAPYMIAHSSFIASIDPSTCTGCRLCSEQRCPVQAITAINGNSVVSNERCIGCGVCATACPSESIRLVRRPQTEQLIPSKDIINWSLERASNRGGTLTRLALRSYVAWRGH